MSKGPFHCLREMDNVVRVVNFMSMGLLPYFVCCKIGSLARSKASSNTMVVNKM